MDLKDKAAIVTGGTKGIGYAIAEDLVKSGANVVVCGRKREDVQAAAETLTQLGRVEAVSCDVRDENHIKMLIEHCAEAFGGIDILINNAGIGYFGKR